MIRRLKPKLKKLGSRIVDHASFSFINSLQIIRPIPKNLPDIFEEYLNRHKHHDIESHHSNCLIPETQLRLTSGRLTFPSPLPGSYPENNVAVFDLYPCELGWTAPTMLLGHGLMSVSDVGYRRWAQRLNRLGWNAIFVHLPYHYSRRPKGYLSGELSVGPDVVRTAKALQQAVVECRMMISLLEREGSSLIGAWGTSLGGWIFGLLACVEERLQRLILVEPILNIENIIWRSPAGLGTRYHLRKLGITSSDTGRHMKLCCPSMAKPKLNGEHILIVAGEYDQVVTSEELQVLHQQWKGSHYYSFPQGHVGYRLMPESFRLAQELWAEDFK